MAKEQVQIVDPQSLEGVVTGLGHVLAVQAALGGQFSSCAKKDLGGDAPSVSRPVTLCQKSAHHFLRGAMGIDFGIVKKVDPGIVGHVQQTSAGGIFNLISKGDPTAKREFRELQSTVSKPAVFHEREFTGVGLGNMRCVCIVVL